VLTTPTIEVTASAGIAGALYMHSVDSTILFGDGTSGRINYNATRAEYRSPYHSFVNVAGVQADIYAKDHWASRGDGTGLYQFGGTGNRYVYYDNTAYYFQGAALVVGTGGVYGAALFDGGNRALHFANSATNSGGAVTMSTGAPSGGSDGDIWLQYT